MLICNIDKWSNGFKSNGRVAKNSLCIKMLWLHVLLGLGLVLVNFYLLPIYAIGPCKVITWIHFTKPHFNYNAKHFFR